MNDTVRVTSGPEAVEAAACAAMARADWTRATTVLLESYGDEMLAFLVAMTKSEVDGNDAFSLFCEDLWRSLPTFRHDCSLRTWCYVLARHAIGRVRRDPHRRRAPLHIAEEISAIAERVRSETATFQRAESQDIVAKIRAELDEADQALLILRINRRLEWKAIARVLADAEHVIEDAELVRRAAALRKRFERIKDELRRRVDAARGT